MASGGSLRAWQRTALAQLEAQAKRDFLAVATPGAGKTTFALTAARRALLALRAVRLVVVAPTRHLKLQWANAAEDFCLVSISSPSGALAKASCREMSTG